MRVVVTGASGFLGAAVARALGARDAEVVRVSRRPLPDAVQVRDYADAPAGDVLVHLAEEKDRGRAEQLGEACVHEAQRVLEMLLQEPWRRVIYASSAVLYGDGDCRAHRTSDPVFASDVYSRMKLAGEKAVLQSGVGAVVRLANLYGRGMSEGNVLSAILRQLDDPAPLTIRDDTPVRDFVWAEDAAEAIARLALSDETGCFNVGSGAGISVGQLAALALALAGRPEHPVKASQPQAKRSCIVLDISATAGRLGWTPATSLEHGLRELLRNRARAAGMSA